MSRNREDGRSEAENSKLDALLAAYREACPDPEPGANFMPMLWRKIETRQTFVFAFRRMARAFVTVAAAICVLMAVILVSTRSGNSGFYSASYVEILAAEQAPDGLDLTDLARGDGPEGNF